MTTSTITLTRAVAATPAWVFTAWTDADRLAAWWWPQLPGTTYDLDARVGGRFRIHGPAIGATVTGVYLEVDPPLGLAFTWCWEDDDDAETVVEDTVVVSLQPDDDRTRVTVAHTSSAHEPDGAAEQGWSDVLDRLVGVAGQSTSSRS
jgi:uncharacterized protein YndB with AHSA1/START domain